MSIRGCGGGEGEGVKIRKYIRCKNSHFEIFVHQMLLQTAVSPTTVAQTTTEAVS